MEEGPERDASAVEQGHVIDDDDDDEDSVADTPDLWMLFVTTHSQHEGEIANLQPRCSSTREKPFRRG